MAPLLALFFTLCGDYFLLHSLGVTQVPEALATTMGSSRKSAAEALMSFLETTTFLASFFRTGNAPSQLFHLQSLEDRQKSSGPSQLCPSISVRFYSSLVICVLLHYSFSQQIRIEQLCSSYRAGHWGFNSEPGSYSSGADFLGGTLTQKHNQGSYRVSLIENG